MISPASRHRMTVRTVMEQEARADGIVYGDGQQTQYNMHLSKLRQDLVRLSHYKSKLAKAEIKRELIPEYQTYLDAVLSAGKSNQNDILVRLIVWNLDVGDYQQMLKLATFALDNDMVLPGGFSRDLPNFLAEEVATIAMHKEKPSEFLDVLQVVYGLVNKCDLHDEVNAKLHQSLGMALEPIDKEKALFAFRKAIELNPKISVKRHVNRIAKNMEH